MARCWYEPLSFIEWLKRVFSFLNVALFLLTVVFFFSEFRYDWFEKLVGSYLVSTNELRPETGLVWETGKQTNNAHEYLNTIVNKKEDIRQNANKAGSFSELLSSLLPGEWVTLEKQQFKSLYLSLERSTSLKIIDPARLVWLLNGSNLDRIFCEGNKDGINIFFIDSENRVIKEIELQKKDIIELENSDKPLLGVLTDLAGFQDRIYPAQIFFGALLKLPAEIIPDLMVNPEALLRQEGKIIRVGIFNESVNGYIKLGFEFESPGGNRIVFLKGREWAVWQLSLNLKGEGK
ncbi:MAG: hypothetical protein A3J80_11120 [Desulfobacula sp. RIFOXYB2_FULL_45_6]|nr:MAG: hypothetical protein A3J80_11120 [Desulfobacula sp. RIFOXYB2_FULL_45_6]